MKWKVPFLTKASHSMPCCKKPQRMASPTSPNAVPESSWHSRSTPIRNKTASTTTSTRQQPSHSLASMQQMSAMEIQEMKDAFNFFDENNDGKITLMELGMALKRLGDNPTDKEVKEMLKEVDSNGDGVISLEEFMSLQPFLRGIFRQVDEDEKSYHEDLREAFLRFDANKDGLISPQELQGVMARLGRSCTLDECCSMIKHIDHDGDGHVSFDEFQLMMA